MTEPHAPLIDAAGLRAIVDDFDRLLGLDGDFWCLRSTEFQALDSPDQVHELARDLLVELFGLEVRGL